MNLFLQEKQSSYRAQRTASQGASVTLVTGPGCFFALFDCALRCAEVLGDRSFKNLSGEGEMPVPSYEVALEDVFLSCQKLSEKYSVALVDFASDGRFVLVWKIPFDPKTVSLNPEDY